MIATTVLIVIAVTLSIAIFNWQSSTLTNFSTSLETATKEKLQCQRASLAIFSASYNCNAICDEGTSHIMSLTLNNPGDVVLNPKAFFIKNITGGLFELEISGELGLGQSLAFQNITTSACHGINRVVDEIIITTDCPEVVGTVPGASIDWQNCPAV